MIRVLKDILMPDELPSGDKAVYVFLEIMAFCFALASVDALVAARWIKSACFFLVAIAFFLAGIKWPKIKVSLFSKPEIERLKSDLRWNDGSL